MNRVVLDQRDFDYSDGAVQRKTPKALSDLMRDERKAGGLTQAALAKKCRTRQARVSGMECGRVETSIEFLVRVAAAVGKSVEISIR